MDKNADFEKAWRARFSTDVPPELGLSDLDESNPESISQALLVCKTRIDGYQKKLHQQEFLHGYLWDLLHKKKNNLGTDNVSDNVFLPSEKATYDTDKVKISNIGYGSGSSSLPYPMQPNIPGRQTPENANVDIKQKAGTFPRSDSPSNSLEKKKPFSTNNESFKARQKMIEGAISSHSKSFGEHDRGQVKLAAVNQADRQDYMNIDHMQTDGNKKSLERVGSEPISSGFRSSIKSKNPKPVPAPRPSVKGPTVKERASAIADEMQERITAHEHRKAPSPVTVEKENGGSIKYQKPIRRPHQYEYVTVEIGKPPENNGQESVNNPSQQVINIRGNRTESVDSNDSVPSPGTFSSFKPPPSLKELENSEKGAPPPVFKRSDSLNSMGGSFKSKDGVSLRHPKLSNRTDSLDSNISVPDSPKLSSRNRKLDDVKEHIYDSPIPTDNNPDTEDDSSSDEEPVYFNVLLLKQRTLQKANTIYASVDNQREHVENQARRLSKKFTQSLDLSGKKRPLPPKVAPPMLRPVKETIKIKGAVETESQDSGPIEERSNSVDSLGSIGSTDSSRELDTIWKKRQSMALATTGDTDSTSTDDLDMEVPVCQESEKLQMRKWVVKSILESEKVYVNVLDVLQQYMKSFRAVSKDKANMVIPDEDIDNIFFKIPELHRIHFEFLKNLEQEVTERWTSDSCIAQFFKLLAVEELPLASEYLKNYHKAISTIHKLYEMEEHKSFMEYTTNMKVVGMDETANLEELLHKPVVRVQRNTLVLHDLIRCTPTIHPDYDLLQKTLKLAQDFLENFQSPKGKDAPENQRYLARYSPIVEQVGKKRKLRQVFLFNDIIICAKQKITGSKKIQHEFKWAIPLVDLELEQRLCAQEEKRMADFRRDEIDNLQRKVSELQSELKSELTKLRQEKEDPKMGAWSTRGVNKNIDKIRKKLMTQETALVLASPHLVFKLKHKRHNKTFTLLMASDYERDNWKETINGLMSKVTKDSSLRGVDLEELINTVKLPRMNVGLLDNDELGLQLEQEHLFGNLHVTIHRLVGLQAPADTFCCVEVDSFGHFFMKAKTNLIHKNKDPVWNEEFEVDLEGAQTLRILVYKMGSENDQLIGKCALELSKAWLRGDFQEKSISINEEMSVCASLKYISRNKTLSRRPSNIKGGVFGVPISQLAKRECVSIPVIIRACVEEVELRGLDDVGIYRISGLSSEIQRMKKAFEKSCKGAQTHARDVDINVLSSLLKLYFRELPEALFTDHLYPKLVEATALSDPEVKERSMMGLIRSLPQPNHSVVNFLLSHLVKIASNEGVNKMSLHNLATVFGPTLLRPAAKDQEPVSIEMFSAQARDAMTQTGILLHFLNLKAKGVDFGTRL